MAGERALLLHPPGLEFVAAFFGCLYAGVVAVPAYPPRLHRPDPRIEEIVADAQAKLVLTTADVLSGLEARRSQMPGLAGRRWLATDTLPLDLADRWRERSVDADDVAFLQYTSGSTVTPKGVMVSHENILDNSAHMARLGRPTADSVGMSWLPHFHDMGLLYGIIQPLYAGFTGFLMPPASFLQRPLRWLRAISQYKATHCGAPNFAYDLCTSRITPEQRASLDLGSWRIAFNGAEPVRRTTLERFAEAFGPAGFRGDALCAAYGLAEATLMVSVSRPATPLVFYRAGAAELERNRVVPAPEGDTGARTLVGCGHPGEISPAVIVDPETRRRCRSGEIGEIWVSGRSVAVGYWNRPEETAKTFGACLSDSGEGPFLRTGDLGCVEGGQLFVTGRIKEMIIIRGLNHYPQDIEHTVQASHSALRPGAGAAFSVEQDGDERLVIVQEVERSQRSAGLDEVAAAIRRAVTEEHEVEPHAVVLIRPASILKTSSGKIQRRGCRTAFLEGTLGVLHEWRRPAGERPEPPAEPAVAAAPRSETEIIAWLVARLARESGIDAEEIDLGQPFASFGVDSARALLLVGDLETWLGRRLPPILLWNYPTVEALARHLAG
jgi:acyl-CoA synthetase (AMP-forming)/AMP-acid ligase II/acyl carrier protein